MYSSTQETTHLLSLTNAGLHSRKLARSCPPHFSPSPCRGHARGIHSTAVGICSSRADRRDSALGTLSTDGTPLYAAADYLRCPPSILCSAGSRAARTMTCALSLYSPSPAPACASTAGALGLRNARPPAAASTAHASPNAISSSAMTPLQLRPTAMPLGDRQG